MAETETAETKEDFGRGKSGIVTRWLEEISAYERTFETWQKEVADIVRIYRAEPDSPEETTRRTSRRRLNILWSNTETLRPAIYGRPPQPDITRTNKDRNQAARAAAVILERTCRNQISRYGFDPAMRSSVTDYLLAARGQIWVRYVPTYGPERKDRIFLQEAVSDDGSKRGYRREDTDEEVTDTTGVQTDDDGLAYIEDKPYRPVVAECAKQEHVAWNNWGHTPAPTWEKVGAVWKKEMMTRAQLVERFGKEKGDKVGLTKKVHNIPDEIAQQYGDVFMRAEVAEICDKDTGKFIWISEGYKEGPLDEMDDPLHLEDFFPCPPPLYGTMTTDTLVPVPEYTIYKTQAQDIDILTERIHLLSGALRVVGVYDSEVTELKDLLSGRDNQMIAVDSWAMLAEKGGLRGATDYLPIEMVANTLGQCIEARQELENDVYKLTGISDLVRGQGTEGQPRTAAEQSIKAQYAGLRISNRQLSTNRFAVGVTKIVAEIAAEHFSADTLREASGWDETDEARQIESAYAEWEEVRETVLEAFAEWQGQRQAFMEIQQSGGQWPEDQEPPPEQPEVTPDQIPDPPPTSDEVFEAALEILRSDKMRGFDIEISTDAMVVRDQQQEQANRIEFASTMNELATTTLAAKAEYPEAAPLLGEIMMYAARGMKAGRGMEAAIETFSETLRDASSGRSEEAEAAAAEAAAGNGPVDMLKAQVEMARLTLEKMEVEQKTAIEQAKLRAEEQDRKFDQMMELLEAKLKGEEIKLERQKTQQEGALRLAEIEADVNARASDGTTKVTIEGAKIAAAREASERSAEVAREGNRIKARQAQGQNQQRSASK